MTIHWKAVEQYFTVVLTFVFQFYPGCNFGKFLNPSERSGEIIPKSCIVDKNKLVYPGNIIEEKVSILRECICSFRSFSLYRENVVRWRYLMF